MNIKLANILKYSSTSKKNDGVPFFQTEDRDEDHELEGNSQTDTQVVMPTVDVPADDVIIVGDNSTEEEQQSNSESHCK